MEKVSALAPHAGNGFDPNELLAAARQPVIEAKAAAAAAAIDDNLVALGMSDHANALALAMLRPGEFLRCDAYGWLYWDGRQWVTDNAEAALDRAVVEMLRRRVAAATSPAHFERGGELRKFCTPNVGRREGCKALYGSFEEVVTTVDAFDADPNLLNCQNGVVDLRTGVLSPHNPAQRFMHCTAVDYDPGADDSAWVSWLVDAVGPEQADWLQMATGYSLTGHTREEVLFYLFGPQRAGKGTFTETLLTLLGRPLATEVNFSTFTAQRTGDTQNFDLAPLKPCRFVAASESNLYERLNEAKVKAMTGGNEIYCAFKHRTHFGYRPRFKVWLSSNQPVNADPDDAPTWGRIRIVEFPHSHAGAEDKTLKETMRSSAMLSGVLAWAVRGAMRWYALGAAGLPEPQRSVALKDEHRGALDTVGMWIGERVIACDGCAEASAALYQSYKSWCVDNGVPPKQQRAFTNALQHKGFTADRMRIDGSLQRVLRGLRLA